MVSWNKILGVASIAAATALLGMVAFDVPYFKSVYFLRIDLGNGTANAVTANRTNAVTANQTNPFIDLGVLGFCTDLKDGRGLQCSTPQVGYNISQANRFIDGTLPPALSSAVNAVASTLAKVLVLHIVAFGIALISFAFASLAFLGAPIADRCSSCFCGFAGSAAFAVFIFDIAFFEIIKKRIDDGNAGSVRAIIGPALFLTLLAWLLLFITPLMFLIGRFCGWCHPCSSPQKHNSC